MKKYELMIITKVALGEKGAQEVSNQIKDLINSAKGKVLDSKSLGKRTFAYKIGADTEGYYETIEFEMDAQKIGEFRRKLDFLESLVRYLVSAVS